MTPSLLLVGTLWTAPAAPPPSASPGAVVVRRLGTMGTWLALEVEAPDRATAIEASERAIRAVEETEARLSTWRDASELARLNAAPAGAPVALSPALARDLGLAFRVSEETGGAFDPAIGALVRCWGLRSGGRVPTEAEIAGALAASDARLVEIAGDTAVRRHAGVLVEEGGFGKGVALDDAVAAIRAAGATGGLLDFGGQVALAGTAPRRVDIADPRDRARPALRLTIGSGSLSTSGQGERPGHLLDPRTGRPVRDFGSVSVWAESAARADALSTALYVLGPSEAIRWARARGDVAVVVIEDLPSGLRARATGGLRGRLEAVLEGVDLTFEEAGGAPSVSERSLR